WLRDNGFTGGSGGIPEANIHFHATREEKLGAIDSLGCDIFVDDMIEVLADEAFPAATQGVLFRQDGSDEAPEGILRASSWDSVRLLVETVHLMGSDAYRTVVEELGCRPERAQPLGAPGNNRLLRIVVPDARSLVLKRYLQDSRDPRRRIPAEFRALSLLWNAGVTNIPRPHVYNEPGGFALFSFVDGVPMREMAIDRDHILQAAAFLHELKKVHARTRGERIPEGADSRRCLADYVRHIDRRLRSILDGLKTAPRADEARKLIEERLLPFKEKVTDKFHREVAAQGLDTERPIPEEERTLSPSDFGFHNAILGPDKRVHFLDFEYFGRDDPAKLIADFIHHAAQDLPPERHRLFIEEFHRGFPQRDAFLKRLRLVLDPIGLEWLLIILNVLTPESRARRGFSRQEDEGELVARRLGRAEARLGKMAEYAGNGPFLTAPVLSPLLDPEK
ncbi:phosphotransferase, partial [Elusimicrobiota bacterium]